MKDPREPYVYYEDPDIKVDPLEKLKGKLDDLLDALATLREKSSTTPATKQIVDDEMFKLEQKRYQYHSHRHARDVIDALASGGHDNSIEAIKEALDLKAFFRVEPYMVEGGEQIENQVFGDS